MSTNGHPNCLRIALIFFVLTFALCILAVSAQELGVRDGGSLAPPAAVRAGEADPRASQPRPSTGTRSGSKSFAVTTATYAGLAAADWFYSSQCFQHIAHCTEQNPLYRRVSRSPVAFALAKGAMTSGSIYAVWKLRAKHPRVAWVLLGTLTGLQAVVVKHNMGAVR